MERMGLRLEWCVVTVNMYLRNFVEWVKLDRNELVGWLITQSGWGRIRVGTE